MHDCSCGQCIHRVTCVTKPISCAFFTNYRTVVSGGVDMSSRYLFFFSVTQRANHARDYLLEEGLEKIDG